MPTPTIPSCFLGRLIVNAPGMVITNTMYYACTPAPTTLGELRVIGNAIFNAWATPLKAIYGSNVTLDGMWCSWQTGAGSSLEDTTTSGAVAGTVSEALLGEETSSSADDLPAATALVIKKLTGQAGPNKRGRWFFGGCSEELQEHGEIINSYRDRVLAVCAIGAMDITVAAGGTYAGCTAHARHWDRKTNTLVPIAVCRAVVVMSSRRDRRSPRPVNQILV